jgi:hypothetical protein
MAGPVFKNLVRLELLESVRADYLVRFLRPYESYCRSKGVWLDGVDFNQTWIERLYRVLSVSDPKMPPELLQALLDIVDLVGETEHDQIICAAKERQLDLFKRTELVNPAELVFKMYLENRALFEETRARIVSSEARGFVDFPAKDARPLKSNMSDTKQSSIANKVGDWCASRNRTPFCQIIFTDNDPELVFLLIHGRPPTTHGVIEADHRSQISYTQESQDLVILNKQTRTLSVHAQYSEEQDFYRRVFGQAFFDDEDHFTAAPVYFGSPLVEDRSAALSPHGVPGLRKVRLRELGVTYKTRRQRRVRLVDSDLAPLLDGPEGDDLLIGSEIRYFKLALEISLLTRSLVVEVMPPNRLEHDRRIASNMVNEFLIARGFMRHPEIAYNG